MADITGTKTYTEFPLEVKQLQETSVIILYFGKQL